MIAISDRTRSLLYITSASLLVVWSAGTASFERANASEPSISPDIREAARSGIRADDAAEPDPTVPPIGRDPFAARAPQATPVAATPAPLSSAAARHRARGAAAGKGGLRVPDLGDDGGDDADEPKVSLQGVIAGGSASGAVALVDTGHGTQFLHIGDSIGGRKIVSITATGIVLSDGSRVGLANRSR
jgi:hypothetical protein